MMQVFGGTIKGIKDNVGLGWFLILHVIQTPVAVLSSVYFFKRYHTELCFNVFY